MVHEIAPPVRSFAVVMDILYQLDVRWSTEDEDTI